MAYGVLCGWVIVRLLAVSRVLTFIVFPPPLDLFNCSLLIYAREK